MKLVLCLVFCLGTALARVDDWSWLNNEGQSDRRSHMRNFLGKNTQRWESSYGDDETTGTTCQVSGRKVNTFRNSRISVPLTTEYVVLSKDCSSNPSFLVLIRKLMQGSDLKQLQIKTRTHKVLITPLSQSGEQLKITVNGRPIRIQEDIELKENGYPVVRLIKEGSQVRVELLNKGVHVEFDGYTCKVELSQVTRKNMCGLCGKSDSEYRTRDFTNTKNFNDFFGQDEETEYPEDREFDDEFNMRSNKCHSGLNKKFFGQDDETEYPEDREFDDEFNTCKNKRQFWGSDRKFNDRTCNKRQFGLDKSEWNLDESRNNQYDREYKPFETEFDSEYTPFENKWNKDYSDDYETEYKPYESEHQSEYQSEYTPFKSLFKSWKKPENTNEQYGEYESEFDQSHSRKRINLKHKLINLEDKICVSLKRVPQCPVNTRPVQKIQKRVQFHCINRNDPRVALFEDRIHSGERIPEIQRLTPSLTRSVVVPIKCTKSFY
jgi:hypothetical protein